MASGNWRTFAQGPIGLAVLAAVGILVLTGTLFYLGPYIAILTLLIFGLLIPISLGQRRLSRLLLLGLVILVVTAPVFTAVYVNELRVPSPAASSDRASPYGNGGSVIQDALVTPFNGVPGGTYNFSAAIDPSYLPPNTAITSLTFYVTDCPGATANTSPSCPYAYAFYTHTVNFTSPPSARFHASYVRTLPGVDIWWWNLEVVAESSIRPANTSANLTGIWLDVNGSYQGVEGPVSGSFAAIFALLVPSAYLDLFIYPGIVFLVGLLLYAMLKRREAIRKGASTPSSTGSTPPGSSTGPDGSTGAPADATPELRCPNCQAVVYPNETTCWKCGKSLSAPVATTSTPLASGPDPKR